MSDNHALSSAPGPDKGPFFRRMVIMFLTIGWVGVFLRFVTRKFITKALGLDDWLMLAAAIIYSMNVFSVLTYIHYGAGRHQNELPPGHALEIFKYWYSGEPSYVVSTTLVKIAFAVFFLRITTIRWQVILIYVLIAVCTLYGIAFTAILTFQCRPVSYAWTRFADGHGVCLPSNFVLGWTYTHSALSATVDWTLAVLPAMMIWDLQMDRKTKGFAVLLLCLGSIASVSTLVRFKFIPLLTQIDDFSWNAYILGLWSTVEPSVSLLAGGLAVTRPLLFLCSNAVATGASSILRTLPHHLFHRSHHETLINDNRYTGVETTSASHIRNDEKGTERLQKTDAVVDTSSSRTESSVTSYRQSSLSKPTSDHVV